MNVRRALLLGTLLFLLSPGSALAANTVTLNASATTVRYGSTVTLSGAIDPVAAGETVVLYREDGATWTAVATTSTDAAGAFSFATVMNAPGTFVAQGTDAGGNSVTSPQVSISIRPLLSVGLSGSRTIGHALYVVGRLTPRVAGTVTVRTGTIIRTVTLNSYGRFRARIPTTKWYRYYAVVDVNPAAGYVAARRTLLIRVRLVSLGLGSRGPAVRWLQYSLKHRHYAMGTADGRYGYDTRDAVLAWQKVHGYRRTGYFSSGLWRPLRASGVPLARIRRGNHIEVSKPRQVLYEVRSGKVAAVAHVSTGATGNTPVGHWHIYWKDAGFNSLEMYYSMYFIGGFAIHGYHSVPAYPGSHGCVRTPLWYAPRIFSRWGVGTSVYVFG